MIYLLDSSVVSDMIRENPHVGARFEMLASSDRVAICTIVRGEILFGIRRLPAGRKKQELEIKAADVFSRLICEPLSGEVGDAYADIKAIQQRRGLALNDNDLWIAATALCLQATIVTRDKDFFRVDGLVVEDWTK